MKFKYYNRVLYMYTYDYIQKTNNSLVVRFSINNFCAHNINHYICILCVYNIHAILCTISSRVNVARGYLWLHVAVGRKIRTRLS